MNTTKNTKIDSASISECIDDTVVHAPEKTLDRHSLAHYNRVDSLESPTCSSRYSADAELTALPRRLQAYHPP